MNLQNGCLAAPISWSAITLLMYNVHHSLLAMCEQLQESQAMGLPFLTYLRIISKGLLVQEQHDEHEQKTISK